jgi:serine/threonine-protein kinase
MSIPGHDWWQEVSPYLDQALEMSVEERIAWLARLHKEDPALAARLEALLEEHQVLAREGFLERGPAPLSSRPGLAGHAIGLYTLLEPIAEGGMGSVWLAERSDGRFQRRAAVKFLNLALLGRGGGERFQREGSILARLTHPHIAQLLDAGVSPAGQPYLVLEHVDGQHIDRYCDSRGLDVDARIRLVLDVITAVAHAHANLVVHRDIKPSNVLVTPDGEVKLLDFGIAKLLEDEGAAGTSTLLTREAGAVLTPQYAAPEQVTGGPITTATDVYALGVLLYVLLSGQHPAGPGPHSPADLVKSIVDTEPPRVSDAVAPARAKESAISAAASRASTPEKLHRVLRGDLDIVVARSLKKNPQERYASVTELGDDLQRYLRHEPIRARADNFSYRAKKFVRRNRVAVALATVALTAVVAGILGTLLQVRAAKRERVIAQRRFNEVRQLANRLFDIERQVRVLPGNSKTRQLIVDTSLEYLGRLAADAQTDPSLSLDLGSAYLRVARVQGVPIATNLGQVDLAEKNLRMADELISSVLRAQPTNRLAMLRAAQIAHDRMVLAEDRRPDSEALPLARRSEEWLEKYLNTGKVDEAEKDQVVITGMNVANWFAHEELTGESLRLLRRTIEIAKTTNQPIQAGAAQIVAARNLRGAGDLDGALAASREALQILKTETAATSVTYGLALITHGQVLGADRGPSMGRFSEALQCFRRGYELALDRVRQDPNDSRSRVAVAARGLALAGILRQSNPRQALDVYDEVLRRLAEIPNRSVAHPHEISALAESTYPLRELGRSAEARKRLDTAFSRLSEMKIYPAERVEPGSELFDAICARAELEAGTGNVRRGIEVYRDLIGKLAATAKPEANLGDATEVSDVYRALAQLHRRAGEADAASALEARCRNLWLNWGNKLPNNPFVLRQVSRGMGSVDGSGDVALQSVVQHFRDTLRPGQPSHRR